MQIRTLFAGFLAAALMVGLPTLESAQAAQPPAKAKKATKKAAAKRPAAPAAAPAAAAAAPAAAAAAAAAPLPRHRLPPPLPLRSRPPRVAPLPVPSPPVRSGPSPRGPWSPRPAMPPVRRTRRAWIRPLPTPRQRSRRPPPSVASGAIPAT